MLPEIIPNAIEVKIPTSQKEATQAEPYRRPSKTHRIRARMAALVSSLSVFLFCVGIAISNVALKKDDLSRSLFEALLFASFPAPNGYETDIPASLYPDTENISPETIVTPETTAAPDTTAPEPSETKPEDTEKSVYDYDRDAVPEGCNAIVPTDLSMPTDDAFYISNETPYNPDLAALARSDNAVAVWSGSEAQTAPLVLIIHTHATEAYSEEGATWYDADTVAPRTEDVTKNVVAVGSVMAKVFREEGIPTLHCTVLHDKESYKDSYNRAAETIKSYLEKYPSIKYVFDVHRDSLIRENGDKLRPVTEIDGKAAAQVMSVVGTDYKGAPHADWESNLSLATRLLLKLDENYVGLSRRINLRGASFNQQYTPGSLILEIGSCGNSLEEAKFSAELVALELSKIIKGN